MKALMVALVLLAGSAHADSLRLYTGALSLHGSSPMKGSGLDHYNNKHALIGVQYGGFFAGYMPENSYFMPTYIVGYGKEWRIHSMDVGVMGGATRGYTHCTKGVDGPMSDPGEVKNCPMFMGTLFYNKYTAQPGLVINPKFFGAALRWEFDLW